MPFGDGAANVILIGMPGVGKSTCGVLLAKALSMDFVDLDVSLQAAEGCRLQDIIERRGLAEFLQVEERAVLDFREGGAVVATGGSVVYSERAMKHLSATGPVVYLDIPCLDLSRRLTNLDVRGVVMAPGSTLCSLYREREPLYRRWADVTVDCAGLDHEQTVRAVQESLVRHVKRHQGSA